MSLKTKYEADAAADAARADEVAEQDRKRAQAARLVPVLVAVDEGRWIDAVQIYDGLSTGEQVRVNRVWVHRHGADGAARVTARLRQARVCLDAEWAKARAKIRAEAQIAAGR